MSNKPLKKPPQRVNRSLLPHHRRWQHDEDYWDKLSDDDKIWKAQFDDEYYRADFRYEHPLHNTAYAKRERYSAQNASARDLSNRCNLPSYHEESDDDAIADPLSMVPVPEYQGSREYIDAVAELRRLVDIGLDERTNKQEARLQMLLRFVASLVTVDDDDT